MDQQIETERYTEGYLIDPEAWDETIARTLAAEERLGLTAEYRLVRTFIRNYWQEHQLRRISGT